MYKFAIVPYCDMQKCFCLRSFEKACCSKQTKIRAFIIDYDVKEDSGHTFHLKVAIIGAKGIECLPSVRKALSSNSSAAKIRIASLV
jgi:hypothetical protein